MTVGAGLSSGLPASATPLGQIDNTTINAWGAGASATIDADHWQGAEFVANNFEAVTAVVLAVSRHDDGCPSGTTCQPLGDLTVALWTVGSNGLPGRTLSSVTIARSSIPNDTSSPTLVDAAVNYQPFEGQPLFLVLSTPSGTAGESYLWSEYDNTGPQTTAVSTSQGGDWANSTVSQPTAGGYPQLGFQDYYQPGSLISVGTGSTSTNPPPSTTTLVASSDPSVYGQTVSYTATVSPFDGLGRVSIDDGGEPVYGCYDLVPQLVGSSYQVSCTMSVFSAGTRGIEATYSDENYLPSEATVTQVIDPAPTRLEAGPALLGGSSLAPSPFTLNATLTRADNGRAVLGEMVTFTAGGTPICSAVTNPVALATCSATNQAAAILLAGGYRATFSRSGNYAGSAANGALTG